MKKLIYFPFSLAIPVILLSCNDGIKIKSANEAVKFLESHEWDVKTCTIRASGGNEYNLSTGVSFIFKDGKISENDDLPCSYTINTEKESNGSGIFFTIRFYDPNNVGTECFRLFDDGSAHCYPEQGQEGVFADFNNNKL